MYLAGALTILCYICQALAVLLSVVCHRLRLNKKGFEVGATEAPIPKPL